MEEHPSDDEDSRKQEIELEADDLEEDGTNSGFKYDIDVPIYVRIRSTLWDVVGFPNIDDHLLSTPNDAPKDDRLLLPYSKVRKIMGMDPAVKNIRKDAVDIMCNATVQFMKYISSIAGARMKQDNSKTLKTKHLIQACSQNENLKFLLLDVLLEDQKHSGTPATVSSTKEPGNRKRQSTKGVVGEEKKRNDDSKSISHYFSSATK